MKGRPYTIRDFSITQCRLFNVAAMSRSPWWPGIARRYHVPLTTIIVETDPDGEVRELIMQTVDN